MNCCAEKPVYFHLDVTIGQNMELLCNTSLSAGMMWTYDIGDPYVDYIYRKGHTDSDKPQLSVKTTRGNFHSLVVSNVQLKDTGLYNCYDDKGLRKVGYQLVVNGV